MPLAMRAPVGAPLINFDRWREREHKRAVQPRRPRSSGGGRQRTAPSKGSTEKPVWRTVNGKRVAFLRGRRVSSGRAWRLSHRQSTSDASNQGGSPVEDQDRESLSPARKKIKVNQKAVAAPRAQSKGKKLSAKPAGVVGGSRRKLSLHGTGEERSPRGCAMTLDACFSSSRTSLSPSPLTATAPTTSRRPSSSQMQAKLTAPKSNKSSQSAASGSHPLSFPKKVSLGVGSSAQFRPLHTISHTKANPEDPRTHRRWLPVPETYLDEGESAWCSGAGEEVRFLDEGPLDREDFVPPSFETMNSISLGGDNF